jgi:hypothetical protein
MEMRTPGSARQTKIMKANRIYYTRGFTRHSSQLGEGTQTYQHSQLFSKLKRARHAESTTCQKQKNSQPLDSGHTNQAYRQVHAGNSGHAVPCLHSPAPSAQRGQDQQAAILSTTWTTAGHVPCLCRAANGCKRHSKCTTQRHGTHLLGLQSTRTCTIDAAREHSLVTTP